MSVLTPAVLVGLATGGRSTSGLTAVALNSRSDSGVLGSRWARRLAALAAVGEFVGDKLPQTPSRLQPQGFLPRLGLGAVTGAVLTRRAGGSRNRAVLGGAVGLLGATAGSRLGVSWRQLAARRFGTDLPGALLEDLWCLAALRYASRTRG